MADLVYIEAGPESLDLIKPLWEKLNQHHLERSPYFKDHYARFTFEERKADLLKKAGSWQLHLCLASVESLPVGYCVSSMVGDEGEIESIFVEQAYRGQGIGDKLMRQSLGWLDVHGARQKCVEVLVGNEEAWQFYARYGFYPRKTVLKQKPSAGP